MLDPLILFIREGLHEVALEPVTLLGLIQTLLSFLILMPLEALYRGLFVFPLRRLYFRGPYLMGYGFWAGKSEHEICVRMHDVNEVVWNDALICHEAVESRFRSFLVGCETLIYLLVVTHLLLLLYAWIKARIIDRGSSDRLAEALFQRLKQDPDLRLTRTQDPVVPG